MANRQVHGYRLNYSTRYPDTAMCPRCGVRRTARTKDAGKLCRDCIGSMTEQERKEWS